MTTQEYFDRICSQCELYGACTREQTEDCRKDREETKKCQKKD